MRLDGDHLDLDHARHAGATHLQLRVVELWNDDTSWRAIAHTLGISITTARRSWGSVNRRLRGGNHGADPDSAANREPDTIGNEEHLRGIPLFVPGVRIGGAIRGTRPGDPAWRAVADHNLEITRRRNG